MTNDNPVQGDTSFITDRQLALLHATTSIAVAVLSKPGAPDHAKVIDEVYARLAEKLDGVSPLVVVQPGTDNRTPTPADIKKSITPDALISFIDGKPYKMLRRHLGTHNLTPETYRARYGLPADYPMVSANYSRRRSDLARGVGLGQQRRPRAA